MLYTTHDTGGKTILHIRFRLFFALRELILQETDCHTVVYWDKNCATMFSIDTHYMGLDIEAEIGGVPWSIIRCVKAGRAKLVDKKVLVAEDISMRMED